MGSQTDAARIAETIHACWDTFYRAFKRLTLGARTRLERRQFGDLSEFSEDRIDLYSVHVERTLEALGELGIGLDDVGLWKRAHIEYARATSSRGSSA